MYQTNERRESRQTNVLRYLDIPDAHSSIHPSGAELGALDSSSLQDWYLAEMFALRPNSDENGARTAKCAEADSSLPDAVLVQGVQSLVGGLGLWGPTVQVLEALSGADALLGRLLRDVQLAPKGKAGFSTIVDKQHREAVMALQGCGRNQEFTGWERVSGEVRCATDSSVSQSVGTETSFKKKTYSCNQAVLSDEGDTQ